MGGKKWVSDSSLNWLLSAYIYLLSQIVIYNCLKWNFFTMFCVIFNLLFGQVLKTECNQIKYQLGINVHIQSKHTPVIGTHSCYEMGCESRTMG